MYFNLTRQRLFTSACVVKPVRNVGHWPYMEGGLIMLWLNLQNQDSTLKFKIENFHREEFPLVTSACLHVSVPRLIPAA